jgi:hypothetical protein
MPRGQGNYLSILRQSGKYAAPAASLTVGSTKWGVLTERRPLMHQGTIVDATIIARPILDQE